MTIKKYYETAKAIIFGLIIIIIVISAFKAYTWVNMKLAYQQAQSELALDNMRKFKVYDEEAAANLARARTEITSLRADIKKLEQLANKKDQALQEALADIKNNNETIFNLGETIAKLNENIRKLNTASSHTYKVGTGDPNEQYFIDIMYPVKDKNGKVIKEVPYAWAIFYPNRPVGKRWKYGIYGLDYHVRTIQTKQKDGQINTYNEVWFENNRRKISKGVEVPVKISSSEFKQSIHRNKEFYLWAPHLSLNLDFGIGNFDTDNNKYLYPGISFSTSGYGETKDDLDWKFIEFGISSNGDFTYFKFSPVSYNVGDDLPLTSNLWLGPFVGYSTDSKIIYGVGLSVIF